MYDRILTLVSEVNEKDPETGIMHTTPVTRDVFAEVESITRAEYYAAGQIGITPSFKFTMPRVNYNEEQSCIYKGRTYGIYKTFEKHGEIELYVEVKAGNTNGNG